MGLDMGAFEQAWQFLKAEPRMRPDNLLFPHPYMMSDSMNIIDRQAPYLAHRQREDMPLGYGSVDFRGSGADIRGGTQIGMGPIDRVNPIIARLLLQQQIDDEIGVHTRNLERAKARGRDDRGRFAQNAIDRLTQQRAQVPSDLASMMEQNQPISPAHVMPEAVTPETPPSPFTYGSPQFAPLHPKQQPVSDTMLPTLFEF